MRTLFIDTGHSTRFPGAGGFRSEVLWVRSVWLELSKLIDKIQWNVVLVPDSYKTDWLGSNNNLIHRIQFINKSCKDGDWLISIHGNAATNHEVRGVTTCFMGGSEYMRKKAIELSKWVSSTTGMPIWNGGAFDDRTGRWGRIGMVRDTRPPALLVECGFVSNRLDMETLPIQAAQGINNFIKTL